VAKLDLQGMKEKSESQRKELHRDVGWKVGWMVGYLLDRSLARIMSKLYRWDFFEKVLIVAENQSIHEGSDYCSTSVS